MGAWQFYPTPSFKSAEIVQKHQILYESKETCAVLKNIIMLLISTREIC